MSANLEEDEQDVTKKTKETNQNGTDKDVAKPGYCDCCTLRYKDLKKVILLSDA